MSGLTRKDWQDAITVQDACNLSGVLRSWAEKVDRIWEDVRKQGGGTDLFNQHPINVLFASKVVSLAGDGMDRFCRAMDTAEREAAKPEVPA